MGSMSQLFQSLRKSFSGETSPAKRTRPRPSSRPLLEALEDRTMPSLIASQYLPLVGTGRTGATSAAPVPSTNTVTASSVPFSATTNQTITLTSIIGGGSNGTPNGGTVNFTVNGFGSVNNVAVVNGVAQATFTILAGTPPNSYTVTSVYTGNAGFLGSTGSTTFTVGAPGACPTGNGTLGSAATFAVLGGS